MATLQELLEPDGVVAAGEFTSDGEVVDFDANMEMSEELAGMTAQLCATVTMLFNTLGGAFTQLSGMDWIPQQGWMYAGGDYTVAIAAIVRGTGFSTGAASLGAVILGVQP